MQCENRKMGWYFINYDELGKKFSGVRYRSDSSSQGSES